MTSHPPSPQSTDIYFIKVLIPSICGGAVIGKGGEAIIKAQSDSGAKVKISKLNEYYPGTDERVCLVQGNRQNIGKMVEYIAKCIADNDDTNIGKPQLDQHKQIKILIPNTSAGLLIGREGESINEIKKSSGAYIQVSSKSDSRELTERSVLISGDMDQVHDAFKLILDKVVKDPKLCSFPKVSYDDVPNSYGPDYGAGMQSHSYNTLVFDNSPSHYQDNRNQNYYPPSPNSSYSQSRPYTSSFQQLDSLANDSIHGITRTLEVDETFIGSIIGPKGRSILELQEITDTNIKISKKSPDNRDLSCQRTITINGMYNGVSRAYLLINDKILLERARRDLSLNDANLSEG